MKKLLALVLACCCLLGAAAAAGSGLNETGYPIVNEPITLRVIVQRGTAKINFDEMEYFKRLEELTGIHLEFEQVVTDAAQRFTLMFAGMDYPDIAMNGPTDAQILDAAEAGALLPLNDLIDKYAPNWKKYLAENAYARRMITSEDGNIYSLPLVIEEVTTNGLRDQWMINVRWLKELGMEMPATTEQFYAYLKALKDHAGTGTIPENVIPFYCRWNPWGNGGFWEIFNAFGAFCGDANYIYVDEAYQARFQAVNPNMKEAIKYIHQLYVDGLIVPEMFTDDVPAMNAKVLSKPALVGSYLRFFNDDLTGETYDVLPPMTSPVNDTPMFRQQNNQITRNFFTIFSNCQHPEAAMRLADTIASQEWSLQGNYGMFGTGVTVNADGSYAQVVSSGNDLESLVPGNNIPLLLTQDCFENFTFTGSRGQRAKNIAEYYSAYTVDIERMFPLLVWNADDLLAKNELQVDILDYVNGTFSNWIVNGGVDAEWDAYIAKFENLKLDKYLALYQKQLDAFYQ